MSINDAVKTVYKVSFEYMDAYTRGKWSRQSCTVYANNPVEAENKCIKMYGLGVDCEYRNMEAVEL